MIDVDAKRFFKEQKECDENFGADDVVLIECVRFGTLDYVCIGNLDTKSSSWPLPKKILVSLL